MTEDNEQMLAAGSELWQAKISSLTADQYRSVLVSAGLRVLAMWTTVSTLIGLLALVIVASINADNAKLAPASTPSHSSCDYTSILTCAEQGF